jgi:hypothetical protein
MNESRLSTCRQPSTRFSEAYLERICPMPKPFRWITDWERLHHDDVVSMSDEELRREAYVTRHRRMLDDDTACRQWLAERETACRVELDRRLSPPRRQPAGGTSPTPPQPRVIVRRADEGVPS